MATPLELEAISSKNDKMDALGRTEVKPEPTNDKVLVEPTRVGMSRGGIILPDVATTEICEGVVIAVGPGQVLPDGNRKDMDVGEGDTVMFSSYATLNMEVNGRKYILMDEDQVGLILHRAEVVDGRA